MSAEYSILSSVIPNIATLELFLSKIGHDDEGVQTTRESLLQALCKRFFSTLQGPKELNIRNDKHYVTLTTIFKTAKTRKRPKLGCWKSSLKFTKVIHKRIWGKFPSHGNQNDNSSHAGPSSAKKIKPDDLFRACFDEITDQHKAEEANISNSEQGEDICLVSAAQEVDKFMTLPLLPQTSHPLEWCREML